MRKLTLEEATTLALEGKLDNIKLNPQKIVAFVKDGIEFLLKNNEGCAEYELDNDLSIFCGWSDGYDKNDESGIKPTDEEESTWRINVGIKCNHDYLKTDFDWLNFPYNEKTGEVWDTGLTVDKNGISIEDAQWLIDEYKEIREALDKGDLLLENKESAIDSELLKLGKELVQLEDDYDPYAELYDEKYTMEQFKNEINTVDNYIDILIKYCFNSADNIENTIPEFAKRYRDMGNKFKVYKSKNLKTESLPKVSNIQGLESYSVEEIKRIAEEYIKEAMLYADYTQEELDNFKIIDMNIYGSRNRGTARDDSDLDIVFEYTGDFREDDLFNLLNDEDEPLMFDNIIVDFNPICAEKSGDMDSFMTRAKKYDDEILNKKKTENKFNKRLGIEVRCKESYIEDEEEYWTKGNIYNARKTDDGWKIQTNLGNWGRVGPNYMLDDFNEYFEIVEKKTESKKVEGIQSDRQANSIKWLKDSGYEEYKTGDNYTALINKTKYDGQVVCAMFYGKSYKPAWHYRFRDIDELDKYIDEYLKKKAGQEEVKQQWKDKRKLTKDHDIKVGDIFYTSWGYDQTNIDFYEVVAVRGSRIDLRELKQTTVDHDGNYDSVVPATGDNRFKDDEIHTVSARADGTVTSLSSFEYPSKWDGRPKDQTDAYSGH